MGVFRLLYWIALISCLIGGGIKLEKDKPWPDSVGGRVLIAGLTMLGLEVVLFIIGLIWGGVKVAKVLRGQSDSRPSTDLSGSDFGRRVPSRMRTTGSRARGSMPGFAPPSTPEDLMNIPGDNYGDYF